MTRGPRSIRALDPAPEGLSLRTGAVLYFITMENGDPEALRGTALDTTDTQPILEGTRGRIRTLENLNREFAEMLTGKSIRYGGNDYEFVEVAYENGASGLPEAQRYQLVLREKGTNILTKVDADTFRGHFEVS